MRRDRSRPTFLGEPYTPEIRRPRYLSKPNFLAKSYDPAIEPSFITGQVTTVRSLDDLPPNILERLPQLEDSENGYVLKQYNGYIDPNFTSDDAILFLERKSGELNEERSVSFSLVDEADILKKRQQALCRYFGDASDMIIESNFFVARNENDRFALYEIQKRIPDYETLSMEPSMVKFEKMDQTNRERLMLDAKKLLAVLIRMLEEKEDPVFRTLVPDLHAGNIAVTKDGKLRIYDTNLWDSKKQLRHKIERSAIKLQALIDSIGKLSGQRF